jgi:hypothetical protein
MNGTCDVRSVKLGALSRSGHCGEYPHEQFGTCLNWQPIPANPDQSLRERFKNVIALAGYGPEAQNGILEQWYDYYMNSNRTEFVHMLERYEQNGGDPIDEPLLVIPPALEQENKNQFGLR